MKLLTQEILNKIPPLRGQESKGDEAIIHVKFFDPQGSWTWYATEYDTETKTFFGMVHGLEKELGYFDLNELESYRGRLGLGIERDRYWKSIPLKDLK